MIYLASPYSHLDPRVRERRFDAVCQAAADLMCAGQSVFSPIAHSHSIARYGLPKDWNYWQRVDREHLEMCDALIVLMLDGWRGSTGVQAEVQAAYKLDKPVSYLGQTCAAGVPDNL